MARFLVDTILRWAASKESTSLMRLSDISQVTVVLDGDDPSVGEVAHVVKSFFVAKGMQLVLVEARQHRWVKAHRDTQVLLSLVPWKGFFFELAIRRSRARFKIGRAQLPAEPFDLVVSDPSGTRYSQIDIFRRMMEIIATLQK